MICKVCKVYIEIEHLSELCFNCWVDALAVGQQGYISELAKEEVSWFRDDAHLFP